MVAMEVAPVVVDLLVQAGPVHQDLLNAVVCVMLVAQLVVDHLQGPIFATSVTF